MDPSDITFVPCATGQKPPKVRCPPTSRPLTSRDQGCWRRRVQWQDRLPSGPPATDNTAPDQLLLDQLLLDQLLLDQMHHT